MTTPRSSEPSPVPSRRSVLTAGALGGLAVTLAACGTSSPANSPLAKAPAGPGTGPSSGGPSSEDSVGSGSGSGRQGSGGDVVALAKVPVGSAVAATLPDGSGVFVAQPRKGSVTCFSSKCTHMGCTVNPPTSSDPTRLQCPCHGSVYDALTGAVIQGPATQALPKVEVEVEGGEVVVAG